MKNLFSLIILSGILLFNSCTKEKIVEVEKQYSWKLHDRFLYGDKIQMNSYATGDNMYIIGTTVFSKFTANESDSSLVNVESSILKSAYPVQRKLPISEINNASPDHDYVTIRSNRDYVWGLTSRSISMVAIDSNFWQFNFPSYWMGDCMLLNGNNQCLIPYNTYIPNSNSVTFNARFCVVEIYRDGYDQILDTLKAVPIPIDSNLGGVLSLNTVDGNFYACLSKATIRVTPDYKVDQVSSNRLVRIFKYQGSLYGVGLNQLFRSDEEGLSWTPIVQVSESAYLHTFKVINNELIAFYNDQLLHLTITGNSMEQKEILNDGLEGNKITSISLFKGKVYLTSISGVFTKEYSKFLTYK